MRKFDLSLRSSRSSYFATFRHQLTRSEERFSRNAETDLVCRLASSTLFPYTTLFRSIASMTQKLTLSDISDESKNYLDKAGITTACLRIKSKWTAGGK